MSVQMFRRNLFLTSCQSLNGGGFIIFTGFDLVWSFRSMYQGSLLPSFEVTVVAIHTACTVVHGVTTQKTSVVIHLFWVNPLGGGSFMNMVTQGCTNTVLRVAMAITFCTVAPNICGS